MKKIKERIKKAVTRFKKWLIIKLGGYTEIFNTVVKKEYVAVPLHPKKLMSACDIYSCETVRQAGFEDYVKNTLFNGMRNQIFDAMCIERTDDPRNQRIHFRASLWVIPASEASKLENKEWRRT